MNVFTRTLGLLFLLGATPAAAEEVCRYAGTTDYDGHAAITAAISSTGGITRVDVTVAFDAREMLVVRIRYLIEEISLWRGRVLQRVAVNNRYFVGEHIVRQQWDDFRHAATGLEAYRVQAKTLAEFARGHSGFVRHWDPSDFGRPWLDDYDAAKPERRPDLDLAPSPPALTSPLALAFYWARYFPRDRATETMFLPGFKTDKTVDLPITRAAGPDGAAWHVPLRYPYLDDEPVSTATAAITPDHHLSRLAFDLHGTRGDAAGEISALGCAGAAVAP